jgi:hypothetical protein
MGRKNRQIANRRSGFEALEARQMFSVVTPSEPIELELLGRHESGIFNQSAAEIVTYDAGSQRLFVTNGAADVDPQTEGRGGIDVLDIHDPQHPTLQMTIDTTPFGDVPTSADTRGGLLAVAVRQDDTVTDNGHVALFDIRESVPRLLGTVQVGAYPDNVVFTPDGTKILVANEGQPNDQYTVDPEGSVSIIDVAGILDGSVTQAVVMTATFETFNGQEQQLRQSGVRIFGPGATVAQDLEPEYIAVDPTSQYAWVTLQENNAIAKLDIESGHFEWVRGLGYKDHSLAGNGLDASDKDGGIHIATQPVKGMYQPDGIATFMVGDEVYLVTANEGDDRQYSSFQEATKVKDVSLSGALLAEHPNLQQKSELGKLRVTAQPPTGKQGNVMSQLYAFGGRSFSIWSADGEQIYDSGDDFEQITADVLPDYFNGKDDDNNSPDGRSDQQGPEPEAVVVGTIGSRSYAFIGLERIGGVMVYDVTDPADATFVTYVNSRDFYGQPENGTAGDLSPEGLKFISADKSPNGKPLLVVANEVSGTTTILQISGGIEASPQEKAAALTPGDANGDGQFNQLDIVQVLQGGKYLTGRDATFAEGDWNTDGVFDQLDIVNALVEDNYLRQERTPSSDLASHPSGHSIEEHLLDDLAGEVLR